MEEKFKYFLKKVKFKSEEDCFTTLYSINRECIKTNEKNLETLTVEILYSTLRNSFGENQEELDERKYISDREVAKLLKLSKDEDRIINCIENSLI